LEAFPADGDWGVDADEDEEGASEKGVEDGFGVDIGCYPSFAPALGYEVEEVGGACKGVLGLGLRF